MPRSTSQLTATEVKVSKPREKDYKLADGRGLYLLVTKSGGKHWKLKYRMESKEKKLSLGAYPEISLAEARELREKYRSEIAKKIDPAAKKAASKKQLKVEDQKAANTFQIISTEFLERIRDELSEKYHSKIEQALKRDVYPIIGSIPIDNIKHSDLLFITDAIEQRGAIETAHRVLNLIGKIYKYAVSTGRTPHNITADIDKRYALKKPKERHYPTITEPKALKSLLVAIDGYSGDFTTKKALQIMPYVFLRPFNIRFAEWSEINFEQREWRIPAEKMKMKEIHIIPLTDTIIKILKDVQPFSGNAQYVFPSTVHRDRPMSENTLNAALRRLGYSKDEIVSHSFRGIFSTIMHEKMSDHGFDSLVIEKQLAHKETNKVKAAYNHADYLSERKKMMQWWTDYLNTIKRNHEAN